MLIANPSPPTKYACYCCRMSGCNEGCACSEDSQAAIDRQRQRDAAPDLLAALEYLVNEHLPECYEECPYCAVAYTAIAKARGQNV